MDRLETNIVPPAGPLDAQICFIGSHPRDEENWSGEPFIGSAGQFLSRCFRQVGLTRSQVLLTNIFWQQPPNNEVEYYFTDKSCTKYTWEAQEHLDNLAKWLANLNPRPNLLVALGRTAMFALTGKKRIWKWRGSLLPCTLVEGYKVYPTFHPGDVSRLLNESPESLLGERKIQSVNVMPLFINDLERIKAQSTFPELTYPQRTLAVDLSYEALCSELIRINEQNLDCAIDIETIPYGPDGPILWCIGFAPSPDYGFVVPFLRNNRFAWPLQQEANLFNLISHYFLNPYCRKIFQNGGYDLSVLGRYYGLRVADQTYEDTMWCHHAAYPQLKKDLGTLTSLYTWEPYYKDEGKVNLGHTRTGDTAEFLYNAKDCCVTREIFPVVERQARELGVYSGYRRSMSYMPSLLKMMIHGVHIDSELKTQLEQKFLSLAEHYKNRVCEREGEQINLDSPKQLVTLLYAKHYYKPQHKRGKKESFTVDKDALQKLKNLYPKSEVISDIIEYRKYSKLSSTYAQMKVSSDSRIRTSYGFVSTWRLFSSSSHFGDGGNLQNIPVRTEEGKLIRQLFTTDPMPEYPPEQWDTISKQLLHITNNKLNPINGRRIMVARDLSQAEARFVVWDAEDLRIMELFQDGSTDVHWERTKDIFRLDRSVPYEPSRVIEVPMLETSLPMKELRRLGKTAKHAGNYGMGPFKFMQILAREGFIFEFKLAKAILDQTVTNDPYLQKWHREIEEQLKSFRMLETPLGRRRYFLHSRLDSSLFRAGYAFRPQSTVGEILEQAIQSIYTLYGDWIDILLNVHDEIIYQVEPHRLLQSLIYTQKELEIPIEIKSRTLIIPCEAKVGYNWGELNEFKPNLEPIP